MPKKNQHPTDNELSAFALGELPLEVAEKVELHVSECDTCCETIVHLATEDTFVEALQEARVVGSNVKAMASSMKPAVSNDEIPQPLQTHARYEIQQLIGRGGMGQVYKARHRMMDRDVALKVIHGEWVTNSEAIDRFHREVKSAARLDHRNIVTAHDAEQADDLHFLVMEYVEGVDLAQTVRNKGPLSVDVACDFVRQAAEGLQHAHEHGMVHRDIKPHNLIVTPGHVVKILDFGLASLSPRFAAEQANAEHSDGSLTTAGAIMGTPDFISPEQAVDARAVDGRSDIYSLGMTLYYLLAGRVPFEQGTAADKLKQHAESEPTPVTELRDDVTVELQDVIERMTAKDPAKRFQTPLEVASALRKFSDEQSVAKPRRSIRILAALKGLVGLGLLLMAIAGAFLLPGMLKSEKPDRVYAPLSELESYIYSMMESPHDLVYLNVGDIGPDNNYVTFKFVDGGVKVRIPAFRETPFSNRQGRYIENFRKAAQEAQLSVTEQTEIGENGSINGVISWTNVAGDPETVAARILKIVSNTFTVKLDESCRYHYRNLPAGSFVDNTDGGPRRVSSDEFVTEHGRGERVYYGEDGNWVYLAPKSRRRDKKMLRDGEVWFTKINDLPDGFAGQIRSSRTSQPASVQLKKSPLEGTHSITRQRLANQTVWFIRNRDIRWSFSERTVEITNNGALLPFEFRTELADGANVRKITGDWKLIDGGGKLQVSDIKLDGKDTEVELVLPIQAAGPIRVNIGVHQYNIGLPPDNQRFRQPPGLGESDTNDAMEILGTWQVTYGEDSGRIVPQDMLKNIQFSFTRDNVDAVGIEAGGKGPYKIDPTTVPQSIDMKSDVGGVSMGIYDLQGDTLRLCLRQSHGRPKRFDSNADNRNLMLTLKRVIAEVAHVDRFTDSIARRLLPEAASMPFEEFQNLAQAQTPPELTSQSLIL